MKTSLGDLAEGTIVPMLERGSKVNYIVAKHNYQSDVNGGGHTMLIRAGVLGSYEWENSNSSSYELPEYAKYDTDSQIPDVLESYYQSAFDELTLAACKPVRIKYSPNGSTVTSTKSHRFFILSRGNLASWSYSDGDLLNATVVNALVSSVGNNVSLLLRSTTYDYDTKLDPDSNTYVQDGDKYGAVYIATIRNNRLYDTSSKNHGHEAAYVLPCIVLYDTAGVGEDGILRGNHIPEISSYYFGTEQVHTKHNDFRVAYSVHDEDGDEMTVTELLDGKTVLRTYTPVDGETNNTVWVGSALLPLGEYGVDHKLTVRVTDGAATAEKHYLFRMTYKQGYAVYIGKIAGNADRTGYYWTERHALHDASDETLPIVLEPELTLEKNSFGSFVFTVPAINPYYDKLALKTTVISVEEDGVEIFMGYVTELNKNFDLDIEVTCEGELGYLQDRDCIIENRAYATEELVRLAVTPDGDYGTNFATEGKTFNLGSVTVVKPDADKDTTETKAISDCWSVLDSNLVGNYGGFLRVRKTVKMEDGKKVYRRYLDYLAEVTEESEQVIQFGVNLLDLSYYLKSNTIVNSIIVMGYATSGWWIFSSTSPIKVEVRNDKSIELYGLCQRMMTVDGTKSSPESLRAKGLEELKKYNPDQFTGSITINAADLADTGVDVDRLGFLKNVQCISEVHGLKNWILCTKEVIPLDAPEEKEFTFGDTTNLTTLQASTFGTAGKAWKAIQSTIRYMSSGG